MSFTSAPNYYKKLFDSYSSRASAKVERLKVVIGGRDAEYAIIKDSEQRSDTPLERIVVSIPLTDTELNAELSPLEQRKVFDQILATFKFTD